MLHKSDKLNFLYKNGLVPGCVNKVELGREFTFSYHAEDWTRARAGLRAAAGGGKTVSMCRYDVNFQVSRRRGGGQCQCMDRGGLQFVVTS